MFLRYLLKSKQTKRRRFICVVRRILRVNPPISLCDTENYDAVKITTSLCRHALKIATDGTVRLQFILYAT